jgi:hypothetical protein
VLSNLRIHELLNYRRERFPLGIFAPLAIFLFTASLSAGWYLTTLEAFCHLLLSLSFVFQFRLMITFACDRAGTLRGDARRADHFELRVSRLAKVTSETCCVSMPNARDGRMVCGPWPTVLRRGAELSRCAAQVPDLCLPSEPHGLGFGRCFVVLRHGRGVSVLLYLRDATRHYTTDLAGNGWFATCRAGPDCGADGVGSP